MHPHTQSYVGSDHQTHAVRKVQVSHFVSIYFPRLSNEYFNNWDTTKYRSESLISCRPLSYTISLYAYLIELRVSLSHYCNRLHYFNIGRYRLIFHGRTRAQSQLPAHSPFQSPATRHSSSVHTSSNIYVAPETHAWPRSVCLPGD